MPKMGQILAKRLRQSLTFFFAKEIVTDAAAKYKTDVIVRPPLLKMIGME